MPQRIQMTSPLRLCWCGPIQWWWGSNDRHCSPKPPLISGLLSALRSSSDQDSASFFLSFEKKMVSSILFVALLLAKQLFGFFTLMLLYRLTEHLHVHLFFPGCTLLDVDGPSPPHHPFLSPDFPVPQHV